MSSKDLQKKLEQQQKQNEHVERRLRDVIKAYKGLEAEKKAMEEIVVAWKKEEENVGEDKEGEDLPSTSLALPAKPTIETLKQSFASLTKEKIRRESALQADKKTLLAELDSVRERMKALEMEKKEKTDQVNRAVAQAEADADKFDRIIQDQHEKMVTVKRELERERMGHGQSVAAMQAEYANERRNVEQLNRKLAEAYTKIHNNEQTPETIKKLEKDLKDEVAKWKSEAEKWEEKAARTPSLQLLHDQIANMKGEHERSMVEAVAAAVHQSQGEGKNSQRVHELEEKMQKMANRLAAAEGAVAMAEEAERVAREETAAMEKEVERSREEALLDPLDRLKSAIQGVRKTRPDVDLRELIGGDAPAVLEVREKYDRLKDQFERYKLKAESVLKAKQPKEESGMGEEEEGLRLLITQMHDKLRALEVAHASDRAQYEQETRSLRDRVCELERSEEHSRQETRREMTARVAEMEEEMAKQRERTLEMLAEKERELEATRSILVSVRGDQLGMREGGEMAASSGAPADPPARVNTVSNRRSGEWRKYSDRKTSQGESPLPSQPISTAEGHRRSMGSVSSALDLHPEAHQQISLPMGNESRNIYYEEELSKKEREIADLRSTVQQLDYRMREIEQNYLCKDLQHHEHNETLKEEIRVLEGKLALSQQSEKGNSEYLRNIFVQFLNCDSSNGRKSILKAIGAVLRLSPKEMKALEKRT